MSHAAFPPPTAPSARAAPASCTELFLVFTGLALQGFGGVLAVAQRELCERRGWLSAAEFLEMLAYAQVLPGPNVCNLSLAVGQRWFGVRGALAALAGMLALPLLIVLLATAWVIDQAGAAWLQDALRGMGIVAAGLIVGACLKLARPLRDSPLGRAGVAALGGATLLAIAVLKLPLLAVLAGLGPPACLWAHRRLRAGRRP